MLTIVTTTTTTPVEINSDLIRDSLCLAFEGGSNYWYAELDKGAPPTEDISSACQIYKDSWVYSWPTCGGSVTLTDFVEGDTGGPLPLTLDGQAIARGLQSMADKYPRHLHDLLAEDGDAETGDVFLQCCLFGEIVYG